MEWGDVTGTIEGVIFLSGSEVTLLLIGRDDGCVCVDASQGPDVGRKGSQQHGDV